jgi:hypothetical protein
LQLLDDIGPSGYMLGFPSLRLRGTEVDGGDKSGEVEGQRLIVTEQKQR